MDSKKMALINYITIFGWLYVYLTVKEKDNFIKYHQRQSLGLSIVSIVNSIVASIVLFAVPVLAIVFYIISLLCFILMIIGIINANNGVEKPLPIIGKIFENKFAFIS